MMHSRILVVPLTFIVQAHAKELAANHMGNAQDSVDKLADEVMDKLVTELSDRMYGSLHDHAGLDNTVLGKPGVATIPSSRLSPMYAVPQAPARPKSAPLPPSRIKDPFKNPNQELRPGVPEEYQTVAESLTKRDTWEAIERASEALAGTPEVAEPPYSIKFFVHGGHFGTVGNLGEENMKYMESRIISALQFQEDKIEAVDVRMNIEQHEQKTYRMEVTVKMKKGKVVLSNPTHAEYSFIEAVDSMHDTLKQALRKDKEKLLAKKRHARRTASTNDMPADSESEPSIDDYLVPEESVKER